MTTLIHFPLKLLTNVSKFTHYRRSLSLAFFPPKCAENFTFENSLNYLCFSRTKQFQLSNSPIGLKIKFKNIRVCDFVYRYAHTDMRFPGYHELRHSFPNIEGPRCYDTNKWYYVLVLVSFIACLAFIKECSRAIRQIYLVPAYTSDMPPTEFDLNKMKTGTIVATEWAGKKIYIVKRSAKQIEECRSVLLTELIHPESDELRAPIDSRYVVLTGVHNHLGCTPHPNSGDYCGFYCTCHGSHFDLCGRVRKGPAPTNMDIPPYTIDKNKILHIGKY